MYSPDGTQVTLYLDGVGVPVTQSQRALTTDMAKMSHDFYEAVFWDAATGTVARAAWEIGQSAGIKGVYTGPNGGGHYYPDVGYGSRYSYGIACLFVGRKVDKTLLAIGGMTQVTNADGSSWPTISSGTKSVTFTVGAIEARLNLTSNTSFLTASGDDNSVPPYSNTNTNMAYYVTLGGVQYPYYKLPKTNDPVVALYKFFNASSNALSLNYVRNNSLIGPEVIKREPRFLSGGRYYYVQQAKLDTGTTVDFDPIYAFTFEDVSNNDSARYFFNDGVRFLFDTGNSQGGIFSFTFRIPVYNLTRDPSTNGGGSCTTWYIQPGFGRDLWSLDNGVDAGGCILMGTEDFGDWMDIFTAGMPW